MSNVSSPQFICRFLALERGANNKAGRALEKRWCSCGVYPENIDGYGE